MEKTERLSIALALLVTPDSKVLVGQRNADQHLGDKLEFPGGKIEPDESAEQAMRRELFEETGLRADHFRPLITIPHYYPAGGGFAARKLILRVFLVTAWSGAIDGGANWQWQPLSQLDESLFPAANRSMVRALRLPTRLMITANMDDPLEIAERYRRAASNGVRLIYLRDHSRPRREYEQQVQRFLRQVESQDCQVMVRDDVSATLLDKVSGIHLGSAALQRSASRPVGQQKWCSAACHNQQQIAHAAQLGVDFITLSPVKTTSTHPQALPLGWDRFRQWIAAAPMPVYALGGVSSADLELAWAAGAQGIAAISAFS